MRIHVPAHERKSTSRIEEDTKQLGGLFEFVLGLRAVIDRAGPLWFGAEAENNDIAAFGATVDAALLAAVIAAVAAATGAECCGCWSMPLPVHRSCWSF